MLARLVLCCLYFTIPASAQVGGLGKSGFSSNPVLRYSAEVSTPLSAGQQDLSTATMRIPGGMMKGANEVVRLNMNLMRAIGAQKALDVGFFTGFSALGSALATGPNGLVIGMDITDSYYKQVNGSQYWTYPGENVLNKLRLELAPADQTLQNLIDTNQAGTFDFCFIDADKLGYPSYYEKCLTLIRPGGIITIDNALWGGSVAYENSRRSGTLKVIHDLNVEIGKDDRVYGSLLPIADGLWVIIKK